MAEPIPTIRVKHPSLDRAQFLERYAARVAASGVQMPTANLRPVGSRVRLILELKSGEAVIGEAVVEAHVRIREAAGISLRYVRLHEGGIAFPLPPPRRAAAPAPSPTPPIATPRAARAPERPAPTPVARAFAMPAARPTPASAPPPAPPPTPAELALEEPPRRSAVRAEPAPPPTPAGPAQTPPALDLLQDPVPGLDDAFSPHEEGAPPPPKAVTPAPTDRPGLTLEDLELPPEPAPAPAAPEEATPPLAAQAPGARLADLDPTATTDPTTGVLAGGTTAPSPSARARRRWALAALLLLAIAGAAGSGWVVLRRRAPAPAGAKAAPVTATCERASGTVEVRRRGEAAWRPLAAGGSLHDGDVVRTGPASSGRIAFASGGALELEERASVEVGSSAPAPGRGAAGAPAEGVVAVQEGVVRGVLPSGGEAGPLGLVVRGEDGSTTRLATAKGSAPAEIRLTRAPKGTEVAVTEGEVDVGAGAGGQRIAAGRAIDLPPGAGARVAELLDFPASVAPGVDARFPWRSGLAVRLAWKKVQGAAGYRVQVARHLSFETVSTTLEADGTEVSFRPEADGMYAWRVASRDTAGRYGEYGFARRVYCERSPSPLDLLVGPADREAVTASGAAATVAFTWQSAADARAYRLVIAPSPSLRGRQAVSKVTKEQRLELTGLAPGTYYWGVYAGEGAAAKPIFQRPRVLVVRRAGRAGGAGAR